MNESHPRWVVVASVVLTALLFFALAAVYIWVVGWFMSALWNGGVSSMGAPSMSHREGMYVVGLLCLLNAVINPAFGAAANVVPKAKTD